MPGCAVLNCKQRSENGVRLFLLPQGSNNEERRNIWLKNLGRIDPPKHTYICAKHFTENQFENHRADGKKLLRWNAIPTIFPDNHVSEVCKQSEALPAINLNVFSNIFQSEDLKTCNDNKFSKECKAVPEQSKDLNISRITAITEPEVDIKVLKHKLKLLEDQVQQLKRENKMITDQVQMVFNKDQIQFLKKGKMMDCQWQPATIQKALKLYLMCGSIGYEELRKQNYPLPCVRILQNQIPDFKIRAAMLKDLFPLLELTDVEEDASGVFGNSSEVK
ncbi:uncharacterized protein LOC123300759 [Chrysoperla carnea]|uniref:uncharacterized protein LOC123300759 n=1 Tax=Chrysoperla carnea TaxID=189513 RepID=UPI001D08891E|nr:uncharacterized protein LOC123300759 [Chrysoperla carnea]